MLLSWSTSQLLLAVERTCEGGRLVVAILCACLSSVKLYYPGSFTAWQTDVFCPAQESVDYVAAHPDALMTSDEEDENDDGSNGAPQRPHSFLTKRNP